VTMPGGSTEEPTLQFTNAGALMTHVVSSDAKPSKSIGTEFGRWRTLVVANVQGPYSVTPGANRLLNRSQRRHRAHILVNSAGNVTTTPTASAFPAIAVSGTAVQNPYSYPVSVALTGFTATQVFVNGVLVGASNGTYIVPGYGSLSVTFTVLGATTPSGIPTTGPQSPLDGVIIGAREEITSGQAAIPGQLGGFLDIGTNLRWEAQAELWVCFPATNTGPVFVSVCDEVYASDPESWKPSDLRELGV
jgi:hypothetical protein